MKKNISYRDKLLELASIYRISEIKVYTRGKKYLTTPQLEHILKKNKVPIPTEIDKSLLEIQIKKHIKPISNKLGNLSSDTKKGFLNFFLRIFKGIINFNLAIFDGILSFCSLISKLTLKGLNSIYEFNFEGEKANKIATSFVVGIFFFFVIAVGFNSKEIILKEVVFVEELLKEKLNFSKKKDEIKKNKVKKKTSEEPLISKKKEKIAKVPEKKPGKKIKKKSEEVSEFILPDLNLKTHTVLSLFEDVEYDLKKVRNEKRVKPIYFTQFPKDLDEISSIKLKKETFIKIVLPLVVAENQKILDDRSKLLSIVNKKMTSDREKLWLRQKLKEYKVTSGDMLDLEKRMDIIPVSIAIAQAAKESGWGTSRFALEGNAIFGQWTWNGRGIAPLDRNKEKNHKILRFPILRASVKAYKNNLNTHKGYKEFREKRFKLRKKNKSISGLFLIHSLDNYAETGKEYTKILQKIIEQNILTDFENVMLTNTVERKELNL